jgi:hypothetical protein
LAKAIPGQITGIAGYRREMKMHASKLVDESGKVVAMNVSEDRIHWRRATAEEMRQEGQREPAVYKETAKCLKTNTPEEKRCMERAVEHLFNELGSEKAVAVLQDLDKRGVRLVDVFEEVRGNLAAGVPAAPSCALAPVAKAKAAAVKATPRPESKRATRGVPTPPPCAVVKGGAE